MAADLIHIIRFANNVNQKSRILNSTRRFRRRPASLPLSAFPASVFPGGWSGTANVKLRDLVLEYHVAPEPNALDMMIQERAFPSSFRAGCINIA